MRKVKATLLDCWPTNLVTHTQLLVHLILQADIRLLLVVTSNRREVINHLTNRPTQPQLIRLPPPPTRLPPPPTKPQQPLRTGNLKQNTYPRPLQPTRLRLLTSHQLLQLIIHRRQDINTAANPTPSITTTATTIMSMQGLQLQHITTTCQLTIIMNKGIIHTFMIWFIMMGTEQTFIMGVRIIMSILLMSRILARAVMAVELPFLLL